MEEKGCKRKKYQAADGAVYGILKEFARSNRKNPTEAEQILWSLLKGRQQGVAFRRQHVIGQFIADLSCPSLGLVIEIDGGYHQLPDQQLSDERRAAWLEEKGYTVLRFTNEEIIGDTTRVIEHIQRKIKELQ